MLSYIFLIENALADHVFTYKRAIWSIGCPVKIFLLKFGSNGNITAWAHGRV